MKIRGFIRMILFAAVTATVVLSVVRVNRMVLRELSDAEKRLADQDRHKIKRVQQARSRMTRPSTVIIDRANDPLAPRKKAKAPAQKTPAPPSAPETIYENPSASPVLVQ